MANLVQTNLLDTNKNYIFIITKKEKYPRSKSFDSYNDRHGNLKYIEEGIDPKTGEPRKKRFYVRPGQVFLPFSKGNKKSVEYYEFLKNSPYCEDSDFDAADKDVWFREYNPYKDAKEYIDSVKLKTNANDLVLNQLVKEPSVLKDVATILGCISDDEDIQIKECLDAAERNPQRLIDIVLSADIQARSLLNQCITKGIIRNTSGVYEIMGDEGEGRLMESGDLKSTTESKAIQIIMDNEDVNLYLSSRLAEENNKDG